MRREDASKHTQKAVPYVDLEFLLLLPYVGVAYSRLTFGRGKTLCFEATTLDGRTVAVKVQRPGSLKQAGNLQNPETIRHLEAMWLQPNSVLAPSSKARSP